MIADAGWWVRALALALALQAPPPRALAADPAAVRPARKGDVRGWSIRVPAVDRVVFRGVVNHDAAGMGAGAMLYPAPSAAGFLAAIITHGLLNESAKQAQKDRIQAEADAVLKPYESVLAGFTNERLMREALPRTSLAERWRLLEPGDARASEWLVETAPVFSMSRDQRGLVLDNAVRVFAPDTDTPAYAQTVRVVAHPVATPAEAAWLDDGGRRLTAESAALLAESLDILLADARAAAERRDGSEPARLQRTFRYPEGGLERMERGELVEERCRRVLLRTLRGWLMSVPAASGEGPCEPTAAR